MAATPRRTWVAAISLLMLGIAGIVDSPHAHASSWTISATPNATGVAHALTPQPPSSVTATCTDPTARTVTITWSAVSFASSYVVYESTTSASSGYTVVATGVTATTWTTGTLKKGTYWYEVAAVVGTTAWTSPMSSPTAGRTITTAARCQ